MKPSFASALVLVMLTIFSCTFGHNQTYNGDCHFIDNHCDRAAGLYCNSENKCDCNQSPFDAKYNFTFVWNQQARQCVGIEGSICLGTLQVEAALNQRCNDQLTCVQLEGYVPSVGVCSLTSDNGNGVNQITSNIFSISTLTLFAMSLLKLY